MKDFWEHKTFNVNFQPRAEFCGHLIEKKCLKLIE